VAIDGNTIVVGASLEAGACNPCVGKAYVFTRVGELWQEQDTLEPSDGVGIGIGFFGNAVAVEGDMAAVGAFSDDSRFGNGGSVYIFERSGDDWSETQKIEPAGLGFNDNFGFSLALDGGLLLVGAPHPCCPDEPGTAYVFEHDGGSWIEQDMFTGTHPTDYFSHTVDLHQGLAVIAAPFTDCPDVNGINNGAVFLYLSEPGGPWDEAGTLSLDGPNLTFSNFFGAALSLVNDTAVVTGALGTDEPDFVNGGFVFDLNCPGECHADLDGDDDVDVTDLTFLILAWGQTGGAADLNEDGIVDVLDLVALIVAWGPCA
jgi:hypothetical protein